ncbi:flagellar associated protein [Dunaliella salina]|uniref:Flagellar associated protein n=1 Tax=Dunaliella salina TaxID=3046 RepID=A0ABQ7G3Z7_DUNSA|nr:flagellar associated protein [Dunaliella salina]|eukprot:KAF5829285.1 flagellar associated protein [Dunaliella salina]
MAHLSNSNLDAVAKNSIWAEHVKKENKAIKLGETFSIRNPESMVILPEKPNRTRPAQSPSKDSVDAASTLLLDMSYLKETEKNPTERLALPVTANMEYGFFSKPLNPTNPMFDYKTRTCDVTKYANSFVNNTGSSPFARNDGIPK